MAWAFALFCLFFFFCLCSPLLWINSLFLPPLEVEKLLANKRLNEPERIGTLRPLNYFNWKMAGFAIRKTQVDCKPYLTVPFSGWSCHDSWSYLPSTSPSTKAAAFSANLSCSPGELRPVQRSGPWRMGHFTRMGNRLQWHKSSVKGNGSNSTGQGWPVEWRPSNSHGGEEVGTGNKRCMEPSTITWFERLESSPQASLIFFTEFF